MLISVFSRINSACLYFEHHFHTNNYCIMNKAQNLSQISYEECLQCYIKFQPIEIRNQSLSGKCKSDLQCVELEFYNNTLFESFFHNYSHLLKELFHISNNSKIANTLYINIKHDNLKQFNLGYIQSILKSNGIDYSYLFFTLSDHRKQMLLDLETDRSTILLNGIQIQINCDENTRNIYYIGLYKKFIIHSNKCLTIKLTNINNENPPTKTNTINYKPRINLFLFIGGLIVFMVWILCLCLCLYFRYHKWKNNDSSDQRLSIVSSIFSMDSLDSRRDDILFSEQKNQYQLSKSTGQHVIYSLDNDF